MAGSGDHDNSGEHSAEEPQARQPTRADGPAEPRSIPPQRIEQRRESVLRQPTVSVEPKSIRIGPGSTGDLALTITNNSDPVGAFTVELDDGSVGWIRVDPPSRNLYPGTRESFRILVEPPRTSSVRAGLKQYGLTIRSEAIPGGTTTARIEIDVLPFESIDLRLVPQTSTAYRRGRHRLELRNQGSASWMARSAASDPQDALRIDVPPHVSVPPGGSVDLPMVVQPRAWNWFGATVSHRFAVALTDDAGTPRRVDGTLDQLPLLPARLVLPLLIAAVAIAVVTRLLGVWGGGGGTNDGSPTPSVSEGISPTPVVSTEPPSTEPPTEPPTPTPTEPPTPTATPVVLTSCVAPAGPNTFPRLTPADPTIRAGTPLCLLRANMFTSGVGEGRVRVVAAGTPLIQFDMRDFDTVGQEGGGSGERIVTFEPFVGVPRGVTIRLDLAQCSGEACDNLEISFDAARPAP